MHYLSIKKPMVEIFSNIPQYVKDGAKVTFDVAMRQPNMYYSILALKEYVESCNSDEEKEFIDFYFNMRMEQLKNGDIYN